MIFNYNFEWNLYEDKKVGREDFIKIVKNKCPNLTEKDFKQDKRIKRTEDNIFIKNSTADQRTLRRWYLNNNYTEYTCMDQFENYYIFRENKVMDYSIILDNYTIPTEEFIEKYNSVNEQKKVVLNIQN